MAPSTLTPRSTRQRKGWAGLLAAILAVMSLLFGGLSPAAPAQADANSATSVTIAQVTAATQQSGNQFAYRVVYSCNNLDATVCGTNPSIHIPLGAVAPYFTSSNIFVPTTPAMKSWTLTNGEIVILLNDLQPGASGQISFTMTPPNWTTPDQTTWTLQPTLQFGDGTTPTATAPTPVTSTATATMTMNLFKSLPDTAYRRGDLVTYSLRLVGVCSGSGALAAEHVTITDTLPADLTYVSSSPAATVVGNTVTFDISGTTIASNCGGGASPTITARVNDTAPIGGSIRNVADAVIDPVGATPNVNRSSNVAFTVIDANPVPGNVLMGGRGVLNRTAGDPYSFYPYGASRFLSGTYAGQFGHPPIPINYANSVQYMRASYRMQVEYPASGTSLGIIDPMPCNDTVSGANYTSNAPGTLCQNPAFHPTTVTASTYVTGPDTGNEGAGIPADWAPVATLTDGSTVPLVEGTLGVAPASGPSGPQSRYWTVPASAVGRVAEIRFPPAADMTAAKTAVWVGGYVDPARVAGDAVQNVAVVQSYAPGAATPYDTVTTKPGSIYIQDLPQLDAQAALSGSAQAMTFGGSHIVRSASPFTSNVYAVTVLPAGTNDITGGSVEVTFNGTKKLTLPYTSTIDPATGRAMLMVTLTPEVLAANLPNGTGSFTAYYKVGSIGPGTYTYEAWTLTSQATDTQCTYTGTWTPDTANVDGNSATTAGCRSVSSWNLPPSVTSDSTLLTKQVKGSLDAALKSYPGVGMVDGAGGTGTYRVAWVNQSLSPMKNVAVYDLLPRVGDTGTIAATAKRPRGSQFTPTLASLGSIPAGVAVAYSTATNPCRPEVLPDAQNAGCVNDWSTTAPADLSTVTALRFTAPGQFAYGAGFSVDINMTTPAISSSQVAWNTSAAVATNATTNFTLPPTESSKVGIARADLVHLDIDKTANVTSAKLGDTVTYTVTGFNDGTVPLTNATLTDQLPAGLTVKDANGGTVNGSQVSWNIGTLNPGQKVSRTLTVRVDAPTAQVGQSFENRLSGGAAENPGVQSTNHPCSNDLTQACVSVQRTPGAELSIGKTVDVANAVPGQVINYTITMKNTGQAVGSFEKIVDVLPSNVTLISASGLPVQSGNTLTWTNVGVSPGTSSTWNVRVRVNDNAWGATLENPVAGTMQGGTPTTALNPGCSAAAAASLTAAGYTGPAANTSCARTTVAAAASGVSLTKTASSPANGTAFVNGESVTYTFRATNTGNVPVENVAVADDSFQNAAGQSLALTSGPTVTAPAGWNGALAPGASATWTATYRVTQADADSHRLSNVARVTTSYPASSGLTGAGPTATANADATTGTPRLTLTKTADKTADLRTGDVVTYTYTSRNTGDLPLTGVTLAEDAFTDAAGNPVSLDAAPTVTAPATFSGALAVGDSVTWTARHTVTQAEVDRGGALTNRAHVTGQDAGGAQARADAMAVVNLVTAAPALTVTKTADKTADVKAGDLITYTVTARNSGNVTLSNLAVTDTRLTNGANAALAPTSPLTPAASNPAGNALAPGQSAVFTATYLVTQADVDAGKFISNTASATANPPAGAAVTGEATADSAIVAAAPSLTLDKVADKTSGLRVGEDVTYTFTAKNVGNVTVTGLTLTDGDFTNGAGTKLALTTKPELLSPIGFGGTLAPGDLVTWRATYRVTQADVDAQGPASNTATVSGKSPSGADVTATGQSTWSPEAAVPAVSLTKTADVTSDLKVGDTVRYTFTASNDGNVTLSNVKLAEASFTNGAGQTLQLASPIQNEQGDTWQGVIPPHTTSKWAAHYIVTQADVDAQGTIANTARVDADAAGGSKVSAEATAKVTPVAAAPAISLKKTADKTEQLRVGDTITYTYEALNTGNVTLHQVALDRDDLKHSDGSSRAFTERPTLTSPAASALDMAPGRTATWRATYTVTQADIDAGGSLINSASVKASPSGDAAATVWVSGKADATSTPEAAAPRLTLTKTADRTQDVKPGERITYTFEVKNEGNVSVTDLAIAEGAFTNQRGDKLTLTSAPKPLDGADARAGLAPGKSMRWSAEYLSTEADAGEVSNTARIVGKAGTVKVESADSTAKVTVLPAPAVDAPGLVATGDDASRAVAAAFLLIAGGVLLVARRRRVTA